MGPAAIAIVRLSGPDATAIGQRLCSQFLPEAYRIARRDLRDEAGRLLDEAMVVAMPKPRSATGEDLVELHLHGGPAVTEAVVATCCRAGARLAQAGEFTRRAFLHGRIDLAQAEAIGALVMADTEAARTASLSLLQGGLSRAIEDAIHPLEGLVAQARAALDFPDDAGENWPPDGLMAALDGLIERLAEMHQRQRDVRALAPTVALRGASNAGKSTLLNALVGEERALTDAAPGTTRDTVSAPWRFQEVRATLWDTAGERMEATGLEARGIARGRAMAGSAALTLWLLGRPAVWPAESDHAAGPTWVVGSRADAYRDQERVELAHEAERRGLLFAGCTSIPDVGAASGVMELAAKLAEHLRGAMGAFEAHGGVTGATMATTARHRESLAEALSGAQAARSAVVEGTPPDCVLIDLERALQALGGIVGRDVEASVLDRVFADFCIGK